MICSETNIYSWLHRLIALPGLHQPKPGLKMNHSHLEILSLMIKVITDQELNTASLETHILKCKSCNEYCLENADYIETRNKGGNKVWNKEEIALIVPLMGLVAAGGRNVRKHEIDMETSNKFQMLIQLGLFEPNKHPFSKFSMYVFSRIRKDHIYSCGLTNIYEKTFQAYKMPFQVSVEQRDSTPEVLALVKVKPQPLASRKIRIQGFSQRMAASFLKASLLPMPSVCLNESIYETSVTFALKKP